MWVDEMQENNLVNDPVNEPVNISATNAIC